MFIFNGNYYKQVDGVAMGSPLGPTLANIFMCHHEKIWLDECPVEFKPLYYRRYVDDIFVLFSSEDHVEKFRNYLSNRHKNINFSKELEKQNALAFLDVKIMRENDKFVSSVYRKPTFSGVFTNFKSFIPTVYKFSLIPSLLFRCFHLCSDFEKFHHEVDNLKCILRKNNYPQYFIDNCIRKFLDKIFQPKPIKHNVPKKEILLVLPFLGKISLQIRTKISRIIDRKLPHCNVRIVFRSGSEMCTFFLLQR